MKRVACLVACLILPAVGTGSNFLGQKDHALMAEPEPIAAAPKKPTKPLFGPEARNVISQSYHG